MTHYTQGATNKRLGLPSALAFLAVSMLGWAAPDAPYTLAHPRGPMASDPDSVTLPGVVVEPIPLAKVHSRGLIPGEGQEVASVDAALDDGWNRMTLRDLPADAQAVVAGTLGREDPTYAVRGTPDGYRIANPGHRFSAEFIPSGVRVQSGEHRLGLELQSYGYGEALKTVAPAKPQGQANRVDYVRGDLTEWYVNGPLGLEQGFTLDRAPAGERTGPLTLAMRLDGNLRAEVSEDGRGLELWQGAAPALRYTGLTALDATGRALRAWVEIAHGAGSLVYLRVEDTGAMYPLTIDPWLQQAKLAASDGAYGECLGTSVAVSSDGSTIVVGAPYATVGGNLDRGAAYVFVKSGSWATATQTAKLTASDGAADNYLGYSVAVSSDGSTIVAGAYQAAIGGNSKQGAAYVFVKSGSWTNATQTAKLTAADGAADNYLGYSVAVSPDGSTIVAGAYQAAIGGNSKQGAAYVFVKSGSWTNATQTAKLTAADGAASNQLGYSVAVSADGSTIVAGAPYAKIGTNSGQGAAYVFVKSGSWTTGTQTGKLAAADGTSYSHLGTSAAVSADGSTIVAGARDAKIGSNSYQGAAYVVVKSGSWTTATQAAKLTAADGAGYNYLGTCVDVSADGSTAVAGGLHSSASGRWARVIASVGHVVTQSPQPMQRERSATVTSSGPSARASIWQRSWQVLQLMHSSASISTL